MISLGVTVKCAVCGCILAMYPNRDPKIKTFDWCDWWYNKLYAELSGKCPDCKRDLPDPHGFSLNMKIKVGTGR